MISSLLREGFSIWLRNFRIAVPFLISAILSLIILGLWLIAVLYTVLPALPSRIDEEWLNAAINAVMNNLDFIVGSLVASIFVLTCVDSFFRTAGIKLCNDAIDSRASFSIAFSFAKSRWYRLLMVTIIFQIAAILPLYPLYKSLYIPKSHEELIVLAIYTALYLLVWSVYVSVLLFLYTYIPYAVVLEDCSIPTAARMGLTALKKALSTTVILWLVVALVAAVIHLPLYLLRLVGSYGAIVQPVASMILTAFTAPLTTIWWILAYRKALYPAG